MLMNFLFLILTAFFSLEVRSFLEIEDDHLLSTMPAHQDDLIAEINNGNYGWTAGKSDYFEGRSLLNVRNLCGTFIGHRRTHFLEEKDESEFLYKVEELPESFDSQDKWPQCPFIIRDQSNCGSCWAFGSTEAFNNRLCIATGGKFQKELSTQMTTSCCGFLQCFSQGCNGGQPSAAWEWFVSNGVVTGGDYDDNGKSDTCWPYDLAPCSHHSKSDLPPCTGKIKPAESCRSDCPNSSYPVSFSQDKHHAKTSYSLSGEDQMMRDIYQHGPVTAAFSVYSDFVNYKSGVYKHVTGNMLGGHAIKIDGWGVENGQKFWWVSNSWNSSWGLKGRFKIARGNNECGIEGNVSAGTV